MMKNRYIVLFAFIVSLGFVSCESLLETDKTTTTSEEALENKEDLQLYLNAAYEVTANYLNGHSQNLNELLSDNLSIPSGNDDYTEVYNRSTNFFNGTVTNYFQEPYFAINRANGVLEFVDQIEMTDAERERMRAEAKFLRALGHFDVVRLFAHPPGYTADNSHPGIAVQSYQTIEPFPRAPVSEVYSSIINDLIEAEATLPDENNNYATKWSCKALLAKVYFQLRDYASSSNYAEQVINSGRFTLDGLDRFKLDEVSTESIFSIISSSASRKSSRFTDHYRKGNNPVLHINPDFINFYFPGGIDTLNNNDKRAGWFSLLNAGQPNQKYTLDKFDKDYFTVSYLHLTDLLLMRAECYARLEQNLTQAVEDVNSIKTRAGAIDLLANSASSATILEAVYKERRLEMIGEGDWIQHLKRRGTHGEITEIRNAPWNCNGMLLQFPSTEITSNFDINPEGGCN